MAMTIAFAAGAAILGIATAIGHSLISERTILGPLLMPAIPGAFSNSAVLAPSFARSFTCRR
jgi:hypothetical protein